MSDHIQRLQQNTFTTTGCREIFNIQSGTLNSNSEKVHYLQRCKICDDTPYVGKAKTKFRIKVNANLIGYHRYIEACQMAY